MRFPKQSSQTNAEKKLAKALRQKNIQFFQNQTIEGYEIDFWLPEYQLVIEVDGYIHLSGNQLLLDQKKDQKLIYRGFIILRIDNRQIYEDVNSCIVKIMSVIQKIKNLHENSTINDAWKEDLKKLHVNLNQHSVKKATQTIEEYFLDSEDHQR